jgi:hypothetical protein
MSRPSPPPWFDHPTFDREYKLRSSSLSSFRHPPFTIAVNSSDSSFNTELNIHYLTRLTLPGKWHKISRLLQIILVHTLVTRLIRRTGYITVWVMDDYYQAIWFIKWWEGKWCLHINVKILSENEKVTWFVFPRPDGQTHSWCSVGIPPRHHGGAMRTHLHERNTAGVPNIP